MPQDHRPRSETRRMMIEIVAKSENPLTRTQIVNGLNRKKTPHLIDMMDNLVDENIFQRNVVTFHNGVTGYVYSLAQEYVHE
jgi:predicted transcriptional regulator